MSEIQVGDWVCVQHPGPGEQVPSDPGLVTKVNGDKVHVQFYSHTTLIFQVGQLALACPDDLEALPEPEPQAKPLLPTDSAARKEIPLYTGLLKYFPRALAAVSHVSYQGNAKHAPGKPLQWVRGKSMDHEDCILRHLVDRLGSTHDSEGVRYMAQVAWRALAALEIELETEAEAEIPDGPPAAFVNREPRSGPLEPERFDGCLKIAPKLNHPPLHRAR